MKKTDFIYKTIQLVLFIVLTACSLGILLLDERVYHLVASDPSFRILGVLLWLALGFSFVFIYGAAYMAYFLNGLVPLTPAPLLGVQGALRVFGSMRFTLLPLCVAGIISCLVRKFAIR